MRPNLCALRCPGTSAVNTCPGVMIYHILCQLEVSRQCLPTNRTVSISCWPKLIDFFLHRGLVE